MYLYRPCAAVVDWSNFFGVEVSAPLASFPSLPSCLLGVVGADLDGVFFFPKEPPNRSDSKSSMSFRMIRQNVGVA